MELDKCGRIEGGTLENSMGLDDIPNWASPALQGLAFWLGYQHAYGIGNHLSEGAIATEFQRLMVAHREGGRALEPEVMYRHVPELAANPAIRESRARADLIVSHNGRSDRSRPYPAGAVEALIEVKHNRSQIAKVWEDIDFLGEQRAFSPGIRAFLIYASVGKRPTHFTDDTGAAPSGARIQQTTNGTRYKIRRVCRATSRIPQTNTLASGHYALMIEVIG